VGGHSNFTGIHLPAIFACAEVAKLDLLRLKPGEGYPLVGPEQFAITLPEYAVGFTE